MAAATPGYDSARANALKSELINTNNQVIALSSSVIGLTQAAAAEAALRQFADAALASAILNVTSNLEALRTATLASFQQSAATLALLSVGLNQAEQASLYGDELNSNLDLMRLTVSSPIAQKLLKICSLADFDPSIVCDFSADTFTFGAKVVYSAFSPSGAWDTIFNVTVTRKPTALSYLLPGDQYIYEVTSTEIAYGVDIVGTNECGGIYPNATLSQLKTCLATVASCTETFPNIAATVSGYNNVHACNFTRCVGVNPVNPYHTTCAGFNFMGTDPCCSVNPAGNYPLFNCTGCCNELVPGNHTNCMLYPFGRTCDPVLDVVGNHLTAITLPFAICDDPFITCPVGYDYDTVDNRIFHQGAPTNTYVAGGIGHSVLFVDPIYIAKKFFPTRNFSMSDRVSQLFNSGNRQDNTVFGDFGDFVNVSVGTLSGSPFPIVSDPALFPYSFNILAWNEGSVPLGGWIGGSSCYLTNASEMCCASFPFGPMIDTINMQLGFIVDDVPVQYQPRFLYDNLVLLQGAVGALAGLNFSTASSASLIASLCNVSNRTTTLLQSLGTISDNAAAVSANLLQANDRITAIEDSPAETSGLVIITLIIACVALLCAILAWLSVRRVASPLSV